MITTSVYLSNRFFRGRKISVPFLHAEPCVLACGWSFMLGLRVLFMLKAVLSLKEDIHIENRDNIHIY